MQAVGNVDTPSEVSVQEVSLFRAWLYLVRLSWQRQFRARQMVLIALGLMLVTFVIVALNTAAGRWGMGHWRYYGRGGPNLDTWLTETQVAIPLTVAPSAPDSLPIADAIFAANRAIIAESGFLVFSKGFVILLFLSFLLPLWSLSFATDALGGERESQSMIWLLTRPLPRWSIYLGKFLAMLPWSLTLNVVGFGLICSVAGRPGPVAFRLYWPAVFFATLTFSALYYLMGAFFKRPAIIAIVYSFFLEVIVGNLPGTLKRISIGFYARCMMFESAESLGLQPENPIVYEPVTGTTAMVVLFLATVVLVAIGMILFQRAQYETVD